MRDMLERKVRKRCQCFPALLGRVAIGKAANSPKHWHSLGLIEEPRDHSVKNSDLKQLMAENQEIEDCVREVFGFLVEGPNDEHNELYEKGLSRHEFTEEPYSRDALEHFADSSLMLDESEKNELLACWDELLNLTAFKRAVFAVYSIRGFKPIR